MSGDKTTLKTEANGTFKRLPSFKGPRDLKLSQFSNPLGDARTKKVFVPNLNVTRKKQNDSQEGGSESNNGRRDRNRRDERQRHKKHFIQGQGVFSEGLAPQKRFMSGGKSNQDQSGIIPKPKLKLDEPIKVDPNEEDLIMKELMRDDFLDDPDLQPDDDFCPVQLPLQKFEELKVKEIKEDIPKLEPIENLQMNGIKIKHEPEMPKPMEYSEQKPINLSERRPLSAAEIIHNQAQNSNFVFFQIPNGMPRLKIPEMGKTKQSRKDTEEEENDRCTLRSLPSGQIGTLQILKSGRARLMLGDIKLKFESGTQVTYKQELVSVDVNPSEKNGNIIHMGNITTRILVKPDWETILQ